MKQFVHNFTALLLLFFTSLQTCHLQATNTDSLIQLLPLQNKSEKLKLLLEISNNYRSYNLDSLLNYTEQAIQIATELDSISLKGHALKNKGVLLFIKGETSRSMQNFNEAIDLFNQTNNKIQVANCLNNKSSLYLQQGEIQSAIESLQAALNIFTKLNRTELSCTPLINMGRIYFRTGDYNRAEQSLSKAIKIAIDNNMIEREIEAKSNMAAIYSDKNEFLKALDLYDQVIEKCNQSNDYRTKAVALANIGDIYYEVGNTQRAIEYIQQALRTKKEFKLENQIPHLLNQIGHIYNENKNYELSLNFYNDALELAKNYENKFEQAYSLSGLGKVYSNTHIYTKALDFFNEALYIFEQIDSKKEVGLTYIEVANIYALKLNNDELAFSYLKKAEHILQPLNYKNGLSTLFFSKAVIHYHNNDYNKAVKHINNSLKYNAQQNSSTAKKYKLLGECFELLSDYPNATEAFKKALSCNDSIKAKALKMQNMQLEVEHYLQKKEQEIAQLMRQSKLNTLLLTKKRNMQYLFITIIVLLCIIIGLGLFFFKKLKAINTDLLSKQKEIEAQKQDLQEKNKQLEEANIAANKLSDFKSQFLANISHEIRTPLNAIAGYSKLLANNLEKDNNIYHVNQVLQSSENMMIIINDLLDFSKIEAGKMVLEKVNFNPIKIITNAISTLKFKAEDKNIQLEIHIDPFIPKAIKGDPYRLSQILINLISNAIKFSNEGQVVTIEARCENNQEESKLTFAITDRGVGIPDKKLANIFESFTQVHSDTARLYEGTGLGLSIVKRLIELQNGYIEVQSKVKKGSVFTFSITYEIVTEVKPTESKQKSKKNKSILSESHNVLLVEDNAINQELAVDTIASWNEPIVVDVAENGKDAIIALQEKKYSAILMDIQMPIMDGHEATQYIRNSLPEPQCKIPIIGMTAHAMSSEKEIALKNGMDEYITKPFNPDELKQKLIDFISKKEKK